ncbi:uncharacterized protein E0L32_003148 [Thyridium curvatum]|uniref:Uncharacterized protein n=1 Tax=Thyridium curvatum TaxID=1093900 RepID=A0A507B318_9PEZI|nr:uncharacterized protein E0L32_003148 [Thyridium curvatum]TPX17505.1 hypothetical protein E0L32_003148 [Thyridium curvatum]
MPAVVLNYKLALQAAALKVSANILVQLVTHWNRPLDHPAAVNADGTPALLPAARPPPIDWLQILEFALFGFLGSQVGNNWQHFLEYLFPGGGGAGAGAGPGRPGAEPSLDAYAPPSPISKREDGRRLSDAAVTTRKKPDWRPWRWRWQRRGRAASVTTPFRAANKAAGSGSGIRWRNLALKLLLDQTAGQLLMGTIFLVVTNFARVPRPWVLLAVVRDRVPSFIWAGWHLWPLVAVCNFLFVPVRSRVLVASCVGFGWSIFLSFFAMRK